MRPLASGLRAALPSLLAMVLPSACRSEPKEPRVEAVASRRAEPERLREGDIRIVAPNGGIDLAMIGDTVSTGLAPQALEKVRLETDTTTVSGSGFGASIEKMVKRTVAGSIGTRVGVPLSAVRDVRYEGGAIRFEWAGAPPSVFASVRINGRPLLESFSPADAEAFVAAVRARKEGRRPQS